MWLSRKRPQRRAPRRRPASARLTVEALESRDLLSNFTLDPLVQVSGPSPFADCTADGEPPETILQYENEPWVAVNPANPNNIVGAWNQDEVASGLAGNRGIVAGVTLDGGNTWETHVIPGLTLCTGGTLPQTSDPWVAFAPSGDVVYVISISLGSDFSGGGSPGSIQVNKSTDGGRTWSNPVLLMENALPNVFLDKPSITVDPTDARFVYAAWLRQETAAGLSARHLAPLIDAAGARGPILFSRSTDGGQTWEAPRTLYDAGANAVNWSNQILVQPDGTLIAFIGETLGARSSVPPIQPQKSLVVLRSPDKGQTWLPHGQPIRAANLLGIMVTDPDTGLIIQTGVPNPGIQTFDVAMDPNNGKLYAVWQDARFSGGQFDSIASAMSSDGGLTWSVPVRINQTPTTIAAGNQQAFLPSIEVAADGSVAVTYYDFRFNDANPGTLPTDYWGIHGHAGSDLTNPANWGNEVRLTDTSFDIHLSAHPEFASTDGGFVGHYAGLASVGNDFVAFFGQSHGTDPGSIFFRRIRSVGGDHLTAASSGPGTMALSLTSEQVTPLLAEALTRWQASGVNTSALHGIDIHIVDLGGATLGMAAGHTIWLDDNAAGWGWFVDATPGDDSEFITPGDQGEKQRMDLLSVLMHEIGHVLGHEHVDGGVMAETLTAGTRLAQSDAAFSDADWLVGLPDLAEKRDHFIR